MNVGEIEIELDAPCAGVTVAAQTGKRVAALAKLAFTAHPYTYDTRALQAHLGPQKYPA